MTLDQSVQVRPFQYHFFKRPAGEIEIAAHPVLLVVRVS